MYGTSSLPGRVWILRLLAFGPLLVALFLLAPSSTAQEATDAESVSEEAANQAALEDNLLEWVPDGDEPSGPEPAEPAPAPVPGGREQGSASEQAPAEDRLGSRVRPDEWSIEWRNGLRLRRNDRRYNLHVGGLVQLDAAGFHLDDGFRQLGAGWDGNVDLRRARLFVQGMLARRFLLKIDYEASEGEFRDIFVGLRGIPWLGIVQAGFLKEPFSLEQATSSRFNTFMERSLANALAPRRNSGWLATNTLLDARLRWEAGVFWVVDSLSEIDSSTQGFDKDWDLTLRVTGLPIRREGGRQLLLTGLSYSHRFADQESVIFSSQPESRLVDALVATPEIDSVASIDTFGLEVAWVDGPFHLQAEFIRSVVGRKDRLPDYTAWGAYFQASHFLTGERRTYGRASGRWGRIVPKLPFDRAKRQLGAIEIAARLSHLDLDDSDIRGGRQTNVTLGLNWYPLSNLRIALNAIWGHVAGRGNVLIGQTRLQVDF